MNNCCSGLLQCVDPSCETYVCASGQSTLHKGAAVLRQTHTHTDTLSSLWQKVPPETGVCVGVKGQELQNTEQETK